LLDTAEDLDRPGHIFCHSADHAALGACQQWLRRPFLRRGTIGPRGRLATVRSLCSGCRTGRIPASGSIGRRGAHWPGRPHGGAYPGREGAARNHGGARKIMTELPIQFGMGLAGMLFSLGLTGLLVRRNTLFILMSLEIML